MKKIPKKWIACLASLFLFILIALNLNNITPVDEAVYAGVSRLISSGMTTFALLCTGLVGPAALLAVTLPLVVLLPKKEYRIPLFLNLSIAVLLNLGLKNVFNRPRPVDVVHLALETGSSFPSGHTMAAACFYGFLIYLVWQMCSSKALRNTLTALLSLIIALVAASRIYLGVHYFSDVVAGVSISICYLVIFTSFVTLFFTEGDHLKLQGLASGSQNRLLASFSFAIQGVSAGLRSERNMVIHFAAMAVVVVFGALLRISTTEWMICVCLFGAVFMAELFNTAIETVVDMVCPHVDPRAKLAKDTAAGAVLFMAVAAAIVGLIIFLPKLWVLVIQLM